MSLRTKYYHVVTDGCDTVKVALTSGVRLDGVITHYDETGLILQRDEENQFIERHAIATVQPQTMVTATEIMEACE